MRRFFGLLLAGALMVGVLAVPAGADNHLSIGETMIEVSGTDGPDTKLWDYDLLLAAVSADQLLLDAVMGEGAFDGVDITVFAPFDKAFLKMLGVATEAEAAAALAPLLGTEELRNIVLYHVLVGEGLLADAVFTPERWKTNVLTMGNTDPLYVRDDYMTATGGNKAWPRLMAINIEASNGVIHTLQQVLKPQVDAFGTIGETLVARSGSGVPDNNGKDYDLLLAAVLADQLLIDAVMGEGAFDGVDLTVFAPDDNAFKDLTGTATEAEAAAVLAPLLGTPEMREIVLYHVILDQVISYEEAFFIDNTTLKTVEMANGVTVDIKGFRMIDATEQRVWPRQTAMDLQTFNGVIHTTWEVLLLPSDPSEPDDS